ncbi:uncharacterized protein LOC143235606 [Tachypleus tridentatus]|uniref:uncharacterized protein LOC143235606 n=1 Tax=Tachypleus tridentatus TaxID=6853 RepID=UPI003FD00D9D
MYSAKLIEKQQFGQNIDNFDRSNYCIPGSYQLQVVTLEEAVVQLQKFATDGQFFLSFHFLCIQHWQAFEHVLGLHLSTLFHLNTFSLQRVLDQKCYLEKEVESLKTVLELKVADIHRLRKENLEMLKELEKLSSARQEIQKLKARNEDLQAMVDEKVRIERQLKRERLQLEEEFQKEVSRLSMEKEELQWRLKLVMEENVLLSTMTDCIYCFTELQ